MPYDYDVCVIGLGPAGMAVSIMASEMGLSVLGIEQRELGGECMSVGCIPSKSLLRIAHLRHAASRFGEYALESTPIPGPGGVFARIAEHVRYIEEKKTAALFSKVDLKLREGPASFVDPHTVEVGERQYTAKRVFICAGSRPAVPPIPGLDRVDYLTNESVFSLDQVPESLVILGGGAIGCELGQAFRRLGSRVSIVHMDHHLLPHGDPEAGRLLESVFEQEGIPVYNGRTIQRITAEHDLVDVRMDGGEGIRAQRLLIAAGRSYDFAPLKLENAGVRYAAGGIQVDRWLRTSRAHIYAPGDCNGKYLFSHAAMHQGMIALMNSMLPRPFRRDFRRYLVPWSVFTEPQIAHVGWLERDLRERDVAYEVHEAKYEDYGAAIAEGIPVGSVRAYVMPSGRILGVRIIGEGASEMINEWGLAIQNRIRIHKIMLLQHAFPSMSFLTKRVSESWMVKRMESSFWRRLARMAF